MTKPTLEQLKQTIQWPNGSVGEILELQIYTILLDLCENHGYGRIPQMAAIIEDLWRNPENLSKYKEIADQNRKLLTEAKDG